VPASVCGDTLFFLFRLIFKKRPIWISLWACPKSVMLAGLFGGAFSPHHRCLVDCTNWIRNLAACVFCFSGRQCWLWVWLGRFKPGFDQFLDQGHYPRHLRNNRLLPRSPGYQYLKSRIVRHDGNRNRGFRQLLFFCRRFNHQYYLSPGRQAGQFKPVFEL
jgi:hypothetical protein